MSRHALAPPPDARAGWSLFLDLDGTLLELIDDPDQVIADDVLRSLLAQVAERLEGRLAIVSGRSIAQLDGILGPVAHLVALSGSHGSEHRWRDMSAHPVRPDALDEAYVRLSDFAQARSGVLLENKSYGVALHYRQVPEIEPEAQAFVAALADTLDLKYQPGKMMSELRMPGGDKGKAVHMLMARAPMAGTRPLFVGDDYTDEPGFEAARELGGAGVLVGDREPTAATHGLADPAAVRAWLEEIAA